jgi:hypothetical protein
MGGSSIDQSNTPHPSREEQAVKVKSGAHSAAQNAARARIMKMLCRRFFRPLCMKKYYGRNQKKNKERKQVSSVLTEFEHFCIFEV